MKHEGISEADYLKAIEAGKLRRETEFVGEKVRYDADGERFVLIFEEPNNFGVIIPASIIMNIAKGQIDDLSDVRLTAAGTGIKFAKSGINISISGILLEMFTPRHLASLLGSRAKNASSAAKSRSSRENGKKGGRPRQHAQG